MDDEPTLFPEDEIPEAPLANGAPYFRKFWSGWYLDEAFRTPTDVLVFAFLVDRASHKPKKVNVQGRPVQIQRGELVASIRYIETALKRYSIRKDRIARILAYFEDWGLISKRNATGSATATTVIKVNKFGHYQDTGPEKRDSTATAPRQHPDSTPTAVGTAPRQILEGGEGREGGDNKDSPPSAADDFVFQTSDFQITGPQLGKLLKLNPRLRDTDTMLRALQQVQDKVTSDGVQVGNQMAYLRTTLKNFRWERSHV